VNAHTSAQEIQRNSPARQTSVSHQPFGLCAASFLFFFLFTLLESSSSQFNRCGTKCNTAGPAFAEDSGPNSLNGAPEYIIAGKTLRNGPLLPNQRTRVIQTVDVGRSLCITGLESRGTFAFPRSLLLGANFVRCAPYSPPRPPDPCSSSEWVVVHIVQSSSISSSSELPSSSSSSSSLTFPSSTKIYGLCCLWRSFMS
jgi:hypothetical protein